MFLSIIEIPTLADVLRVTAGVIVIGSSLIAGRRLDLWLSARAPGATRAGWLTWAGLAVGVITVLGWIIT